MSKATITICTPLGDHYLTVTQIRRALKNADYLMQSLRETVGEREFTPQERSYIETLYVLSTCAYGKYQELVGEDKERVFN